MYTPHLLDYVIRPALRQIGAGGLRAERLVLGTIAHESEGGKYLAQLGDGPARGIAQIEPFTHESLYVHFLSRYPELRARLLGLSRSVAAPDHDELSFNLRYAAAVCRIKYLSIPAPLPEPTPAQLARYWKRYYNTYLGRGTVEGFLRSWRDHVAPWISDRPELDHA